MPLLPTPVRNCSTNPVQINFDQTLELTEENEHDSSFVTLYSKMMEQYHDQQGQISDQDLEKLNSEYAEWQKRMEARMDQSQAQIRELQTKIEASRKVKSQLDKVEFIHFI